MDDFDSATVAELLRLDSLREDVKGATVAFRHDVLRDWTVGFLLHEDREGEVLKTLPLDKPLPAALARGIEIAARLAIESDATGARWVVLLDAVQAGDSHGSWRRPILLALPRAEQALALFESLKSVLLANDGRLLCEIIRLMIAVESVPIAKLIERVQPSVKVPPGVGDMVVAKGHRLDLAGGMARFGGPVIAHSAYSGRRESLSGLADIDPKPSMADQYTGRADSLRLAGADRKQDVPSVFPRSDRMLHQVSIFPHVSEVRDEIRMTVFAFAYLNHAAAQNYLSHLDQENVTYHDTQDILRAPGTLARAAPAALVDFMLGALIEKDDPDALYSRRNRYGPFSVHEYLFSPASPGQGPFFDLLESAPAEGLRLIRAIVEHATQWRREQYAEAREPFPRLSIRFPSGTKSFEGDWSVYHWARSIAPSVTVASALMALEAWGHRQIDAGRPFEEVLHDVLGPDGSSVAFVCVAIDLALSHWAVAADTVWPIVATPEVLEFDDARALHDLTGVDRMTLEQEPSTWRAKRAELDAKPSRRSALIGSNRPLCLSRQAWTVGHVARRP